MARTRAYRSPWLWVPAVVISSVAQSAVVLTYEYTRAKPKPFLTIRLDDAAASWDANVMLRERDGHTTLKVVSGTAAGFKITVGVPGGQYFGNVPQVFDLADRDTELPVTLTAPDGTTYQKTYPIKSGQETLISVDYQAPRGQVLVTKEGDSAPLVRCSQPTCSVPLEPGTKVTLTAVLGEDSVFGGFKQFPMRTPSALVPFLGDPLASCLAGSAVDAAASGHVYDCSFAVKADTDVLADFSKKPNEVEVAFTDQNIEKLITPPKPKAPPPPIDAEKLEEKAVQVALAPPPKVPPPPVLPPPPPPPPDKKPPPPVQPPPNMTMVEVKDDKNVKDKAAEDAKFLSDKNRDVAEETRAQKTNLEKESEGHSEASKESDDKTSAEIGGPDKDKIRQLEETQATTDKRIKETDHSGDKQEAKGEIKGEGGDNGEEGTGDNSPGVLSMRGIGGRGSVTDQTHDGKKVGKRGLPGVNSQMAFNDYERIMGKEKVDEERQVAARKMSAKKGRWERKLDAIKSSLENFVPDVRPGNQTALKTRAHPYALYIARMHRRIHELWGFGFLEDLDGKGADYPLNNPDLWVNLEISVNPDGTLHKVTIAKTSGKTEFDVAAVDTVISSAPFEATPEAIRSVDGRIYLRWGFYRNWRQCGTFNAEPYILTSVPDDNGVGVLDDGAMVANTAHVPGKKRKPSGDVAPPTGSKPITPDDGLAKQKVNPESSVTNKQALFSANQWISAFATAEVDKLVKLSMVPFYAGGKIAAQTTGDLKEMYSGLVVESGPMKDWKLMTPSEYTSGGGGLPEGNLVLRVRTEKETFAIVLTQTKSGEYRATQLAR